MKPHLFTIHIFGIKETLFIAAEKCLIFKMIEASSAFEQIEPLIDFDIFAEGEFGDVL